MTLILQSAYEWLVGLIGNDALGQIALTLGVLAFAWAFIFLTVRAAVRRTLRGALMPRPAQVLSAEAEGDLIVMNRMGKPPKSGHDYAPKRHRPIKAEPGPRDWTPGY